MARHGTRRSRPQELVPGTLRVVSVRMATTAPDAARPRRCSPTAARATSRATRSGATTTRCCAAGSRRSRRRLEAEIGPFGYRAFVDSAPVMEKPLARNAGLGWIGKHTNLINERAGSLFMLGELFTDLPLPVDAPGNGSLRHAAAPASPPARPARSRRRTSSTRAAASPTSRSSTTATIPEALRSAIGNRIFGCDDCQLVCPWNKFAQRRGRAGFPRPARARRAGPRRAVRLERSRSTSRRPKAARCAGSASGAGCATSRSRSATRRPPPTRVAALARAQRRSRSARARARRLGAGAPGG